MIMQKLGILPLGPQANGVPTSLTNITTDNNIYIKRDNNIMQREAIEVNHSPLMTQELKKSRLRSTVTVIERNTVIRGSAS